MRAIFPPCYTCGKNVKLTEYNLPLDFPSIFCSDACKGKSSKKKEKVKEEVSERLNNPPAIQEVKDLAVLATKSEEAHLRRINKIEECVDAQIDVAHQIAMGEMPGTPEQMKAIKMFLDKTVPDRSHTTITSADGRSLDELDPEEIEELAQKVREKIEEQENTVEATITPEDENLPDSTVNEEEEQDNAGVQ